MLGRPRVHLELISLELVLDRMCSRFPMPSRSVAIASNSAERRSGAAFIVRVALVIHCCRIELQETAHERSKERGACCNYANIKLKAIIL